MYFTFMHKFEFTNSRTKISNSRWRKHLISLFHDQKKRAIQAFTQITGCPKKLLSSKFCSEKNYIFSRRIKFSPTFFSPNKVYMEILSLVWQIFVNLNINLNRKKKFLHNSLTHFGHLMYLSTWCEFKEVLRKSPISFSTQGKHVKGQF